MDLLPAGYAVITATVDDLAGEVGTIYQACGFDFVGVMRAGGRASVRINGKASLSVRPAGFLVRGARARCGGSASTRSRCSARRDTSPSVARHRRTIGAPSPT